MICRANQLTGFYIMGLLVVKGLRVFIRFMSIMINTTISNTNKGLINTEPGTPVKVPKNRNITVWFYHSTIILT